MTLKGDILLAVWESDRLDHRQVDVHYQVALRYKGAASVDRTVARKVADGDSNHEVVDIDLDLQVVALRDILEDVVGKVAVVAGSLNKVSVEVLMRAVVDSDLKWRN